MSQFIEEMLRGVYLWGITHTTHLTDSVFQNTLSCHTPDILPFSGQVPQSCALAAAGSPWRVPLHLDHMEIVRLHINIIDVIYWNPLDFKALEFSSLSTIEKSHSLEYK